jgi:hypothetical protein
MPPIPGFCGQTYQSISQNIDAELAINIFCEQSQSQGAKTPIALIMAPGKRVFAQLPEAGIYSVFTINKRTFVAGATLWELLANGTHVNRGSLGVMPTGPTQMAANETQLLALNNGNLYVFTLASNAFVAVDMTQFNGPVAQIGFADGYFIATIQNSHTFQQSNLEDGTTWDGLNIATVSLFPDNFTSMICDHREIWFFSGKKTAAYYNAGAGFPVFIPVQGAFMEFGAGATSATVQLDNSIFWIDLDERGGGVARKAVGYGEKRISTHAVEFAWKSYSTIADAIGYSYQEEGHTFWVIRFPSANATWVYDVGTGFWHQRGFFNQVSGTYEADHSQSHTFNFNKHLVGDWASGNIYEQSTAIYDDNGNPIRWVRRSPTTNKDNKWIYFSELEIDVEPGLGPTAGTVQSVLGWGAEWARSWGGRVINGLVDGNGNPRPAQLMLRWSNDAAKTWSSTFLLNCGFPGQYKARARKTQLGRARKRVWEISATDPIPWRVANAYVQASADLSQ